MDELIKRITERTGISEDQARGALDTVVGFLKQPLPEPVAGYVDTALGGQPSGDALGGIANSLGRLLGGE